jgi:hypothetical protein
VIAQPWTADEDALFADSVARGLKPKQINRLFPARTLLAIYQHKRLLGLRGDGPLWRNDRALERAQEDLRREIAAAVAERATAPLYRSDDPTW